MLAPDPALATLPISVMAVGMWIGTLPVGMLAKAFGRRFALQVGSVFGVASGVLSCIAVLSGSFGLLLAGTLCGGLYAAAHQSYRFAAADTASVQFRAKAVAWVLAGGICAAVIGPQLVILTKDLWPPYLFAGTFLAQSACAIIAAAVLTLLRLPPAPAAVRSFADGRPLIEIVREPRFIVAVGCGVASFGADEPDDDRGAARHGDVQSFGRGSRIWHPMARDWHVRAELFHRHADRAARTAHDDRDRPVFACCSASIGLLGTALWNFWIALALLGIGWNFAFIGATTLVTECHGPRERNKVQAFNDFLVFGSTAIGSLSSGALLTLYGWSAVNGVVFPVAIVAAALLAWGTLVRRPQTV